MTDSGALPPVIRFGPFALDVRAGELRKGPTRLKVPDQSIEILTALLERPGDLVTRDELRRRLWPENTFVDFEHGSTLRSGASAMRSAIRRTRRASSKRCRVAATGSSVPSMTGDRRWRDQPPAAPAPGVAAAAEDARRVGELYPPVAARDG